MNGSVIVSPSILWLILLDRSYSEERRTRYDFTISVWRLVFWLHHFKLHGNSGLLYISAAYAIDGVQCQLKNPDKLITAAP